MVLEGASQLCLELESFVEVVMDPRVEDERTVAASRLGLVHRQVGKAQRLVEVESAAHEGNPGTGSQCHQTAVEVERVTEVRDDALCGGDRCGSAGAREQDCELVPAEPGHGVGAADQVDQATADLDQERIPRFMAQRVVDVLETVEVDEYDRAYRTANRVGVGSPLTQEVPIAESGDAIGEPVPPEFCGLILQGAYQLLAPPGEDNQRDSLRDQQADHDEQGELVRSHGWSGFSV